MALPLLSAPFACSSIASASTGGGRDAATAGKLEGILFEREADAYPGGTAAKTARPSYYIATLSGVVGLTEAQPERYLGQLVDLANSDAAEKDAQGQVRLVHPGQHLQAAPAPGPQAVLVILITTPDDPTPATSDPETHV